MPHIYTPQKAPETDDLPSLMQWVEQEFLAVQQSMQETRELELRPSFAEPSKPREGMIVYADGTLWNPGTGEGLYVFKNTAWVRVLENSASLETTGAIGYRTGAGGTVTQATSKATGVTLNKLCGQITMNAAALAADTTVSFTLTNSTVDADDVLLLNHISAGTAGSYLLNAQSAAGSAAVNVRNVTAGSLAEAIVLMFAVFKGVTT